MVQGHPCPALFTQHMCEHANFHHAVDARVGLHAIAPMCRPPTSLRGEPLLKFHPGGPGAASPVGAHAAGRFSSHLFIFLSHLMGGRGKGGAEAGRDQISGSSAKSRGCEEAGG